MILLALGALALGPLVAGLVARLPSTRTGLEGFITVAIAGLVLIHILPHAITLGGGAAVAASIVGLVIPVALHRFLHRHPHQEHGDHRDHPAHGEVNAAFVFALNALAVHALLDGVALAGGRVASGDGLLALAVVFHRLPAAMAIWWIARPRIGAVATVGVLCLVGFATWVGYAGVPVEAVLAQGTALGIFQALMAGSLLHVALDHGPYRDVGYAAGRRIGAGVGAAVLIAVSGLEMYDSAGVAAAGIEVWVQMGAAVLIALWVASRR